MGGVPCRLFPEESIEVAVQFPPTFQVGVAHRLGIFPHGTGHGGESGGGIGPVFPVVLAGAVFGQGTEVVSLPAGQLGAIHGIVASMALLKETL